MQMELIEKYSICNFYAQINLSKIISEILVANPKPAFLYHPKPAFLYQLLDTEAK